MTYMYHFYLFAGKFPKLFNFSDGKEKKLFSRIEYIQRKRVLWFTENSTR